MLRTPFSRARARGVCAGQAIVLLAIGYTPILRLSRAPSSSIRAGATGAHQRKGNSDSLGYLQPVPTFKRITNELLHSSSSRIDALDVDFVCVTLSTTRHFIQTRASRECRLFFPTIGNTYLDSVRNALGSETNDVSPCFKMSFKKIQWHTRGMLRLLFVSLAVAR